MSYGGILGHEKVKNILKTAVASRHTGHAYIFSGEKGIGKYKTALEFARAMVCENSINGEPCEKCRHCEMSSHPDIITVTNEYFEEASSKNIRVETIRKMKNDIYIKPFLADKKVYIIPDADTMNTASQNSILKVFEEPPAYCTIILISENIQSLLQTIRSRGTEIEFFPLSHEIIRTYLSENYPYISPEEAAVYSRISGGSIGRAVELLSDPDIQRIRSEAIDGFLKLLHKGQRFIYDYIGFLKKNKTSIDFILDTLKSWARDSLLLKQGQSSELLINADKLSELTKFSETVNDSVPVKLLDTLINYQSYLAQNINYSAAIHCMALEIWEELHGRSYRSQV